MNDLNYVEVSSWYTYFIENFLSCLDAELSQMLFLCFFGMIMLFLIFHFAKVLSHLFVYIELYVHPWDKSHLPDIYNYLMCYWIWLLDYYCRFCIYIS